MSTDQPLESGARKSNLEWGRYQGAALHYWFNLLRFKSTDTTTATTKTEMQTNTTPKMLHTNFCPLRRHVINLHSTAGKFWPTSYIQDKWGYLSMWVAFYSFGDTHWLSRGVTGMLVCWSINLAWRIAMKRCTDIHGAQRMKPILALVIPWVFC